MALSELELLDGSPPFRAAQAVCERAEREIRLIDRAQPLNLAAERARLLAGLSGGEKPVPRLEYARPPELSTLRRELVRVASALAAFGPLALLYIERAR